MHLDIVTPDKPIYSGDIKLIQLPGSEGSFEILKKHAALISTLEEGKIKVITTKGEELFFDIRSGVVEVLNDKVIVLAGTI